MSNLNTLRLRFSEETEEPPYEAKSFVFSVRWDDPDSHMMLTPECLNPIELETWIDMLKGQLDSVKTEARRKYAAFEVRLAAREGHSK